MQKQTKEQLYDIACCEDALVIVNPCKHPSSSYNKNNYTCECGGTIKVRCIKCYEWVSGGNIAAHYSKRLNFNYHITFRR